MPKIAVEIEWDLPNERHWLTADNIRLALSAYCKNTVFNVFYVLELAADPPWIETRYEWASIINRLACLALDDEINSNDRDYAQDAIKMVNPYLGLAEE